MIRRVTRSAFSLVLRESSLPQRAVDSYQSLTQQPKRVQLVVLAKYQIPQLIETLDNLPLFKSIMQYNPHLTNGGLQFQEFPLVKLLHIGLKLLENREMQKQIWIKLQKTIRYRLHRCTIEEHMRLLYIMLKSWPLYRFNIDFITSICLGLKREIPIMSDNELKSLFRVAAAGGNTGERFEGNILLDVQNAVFNNVISKWETRSKNVKGKQVLDSLYIWVTLGISLAIRNNPFQLILDRKSIKLAQLITIVYHQAVINRIRTPSPQEHHLAIALQLLSIFQPEAQFYFSQQGRQEPNKEEIYWGQEFLKLKATILSHGNKGIENQLRNAGNSKYLKWILTLYESNTLEGLFVRDDQIQLQNSTEKCPRISKLVQKAMKEGSIDSRSIWDKVELVAELLKLGIIDWQTVQIHYNSLPLHSLTELSLPSALHLLQIELILYSISSTFKPNTHSHRLLMDFLSNNELSLRNFDWLAFHYLRLSSSLNRNVGLLPSDGIQRYESMNGDSDYIKIIKKLLTQGKQCDVKKLIEEEKHVHLKNPFISKMKKFFTQVRLQQMQLLQPIIPCFYRLPHFANQSQKLAINVYSLSQIYSPLVVLQKRLLNDLDWKVVNLKMPQFLEFTLSQKVQKVGEVVNQQKVLLQRQNKSLLE